jgi:hypothetical protein
VPPPLRLPLPLPLHVHFCASICLPLPVSCCLSQPLSTRRARKFSSLPRQCLRVFCALL